MLENLLAIAFNTVTDLLITTFVFLVIGIVIAGIVTIAVVFMAIIWDIIPWRHEDKRDMPLFHFVGVTVLAIVAALICFVALN